MPPVRRQMPTFSPSFSSTAQQTDYSNWRLFKPEFKSQIEFIRPVYDDRKKPLTVVRPYPCRGYGDDSENFLPYRLDPGGKNFFLWMLQLPCADRVGTTPTSYLLHNPFEDGQFFNVQANPLSVLTRAVSAAVKKGQGKAETWSKALGGSFQPTDKQILEWSGMREGDKGAKKALSAPTYIFLMQGLVPCLGGDVKWGPDKVAPGWGEKAAVIGLTASLGGKLLKLLNEENENFRGDPADFERRYVHGDPVSPDSGRYIYIYPEGGDPRESKQNMPTNYDPLSSTGHKSSGGRGGHAEEREFAGFDCHIDKTFQNQPATLNRPNQRIFLLNQWRYWEDILFFPTIVEQVQILSEVLPASMLEYAFVGEHDNWLTPEIRAKITMAKSATVPSAPSLPQRGQAPGHQPQQASPTAASTAPLAASQPYDPLGTPGDWNPGKAPDPFPQGSTPFDGGGGQVDEALSRPPAGPPVLPASSLDGILADAAKQANELFGGPQIGPGTSASPAVLPVGPVNPASAGFDTPPAAGSPSTLGPAALAAIRKAQATAPV